MSADHDAASQTDQPQQTAPQQQNPVPPPFNPIPTNAASSVVVSGHDGKSTAANALASNAATTSSTATTAVSEEGVVAAAAALDTDSVVPSLMQVYQSMTQRGVPEQGVGSAPPTALGGAQQQQQTSYVTRASGSSTSISIPPPLHMTSMPASSSTTTAALTGPQQQFQDISPSSALDEGASNSGGSSQGAGHRSLRKRNSATREEQGASGGLTNSKGGKSRRKGGKVTDGRWSKRFTWPDELHRDFVAAIFDVGLKHSSPGTILEHMPRHEQITSERVKSHLQKYRLHRAKSKREFMSSYDTSLEKMQNRGLEGTKSLSGGEVAGHLTYSSISDSGTPAGPATTTSSGTGGFSSGAAGQSNTGASVASRRTGSIKAVEVVAGMDEKAASTALPDDVFMFPRLTEVEKQSPIGSSIGYLMGLFFSLKHQLMAQREAKALAAAPGRFQQGSHEQQQVADVFDNFLGGQPPAPLAVSPDATFEHGATVLQQHGSAQLSATQGSSAAAPHSTRSNLEENNMMKREMQNQMAVQNKMRALKQQELNKYKTAVSSSIAGSELVHEDSTRRAGPSGTPFEGKTTESPFPLSAQDDSQQFHQGAGETATVPAGEGRSHGLSFGSEDFWNADVVDEQLFQFLMSDS